MLATLYVPLSSEYETATGAFQLMQAMHQRKAGEFILNSPRRGEYGVKITVPLNRMPALVAEMVQNDWFE